MKCNKCINKPWKDCCNNCKELEYSCDVCKNMVKVKDYIEHLGYHYSDPDQYLTCSMCNVYKHISLYRFRNRKCRLCIYLHRYRYGHTRNQFREHVYKYNIQEDIKKTLITVLPPISVFLTVYPSQCVPYTVSQQGSSFLRTVNLVFIYLT